MKKRFSTPVALAALVSLAGVARAGAPSPEDWRDEVIYQVITDRFFDGDPTNNNAEGQFNAGSGGAVHGGDWSGLEKKIDYMQTLGVTSVWISPVVLNRNGSYHGYGAKDFASFSPQFGGLIGLRHFADVAHARGMRVIIDVVTNHTGDFIYSTDSGYSAFRNPGTYTLKFRSTTNTQAAPFNNLTWYHNNGGIDTYVDPNQVLGELSGLDDLNTERTDVRDALFSVYDSLIAKSDCDGFRIDTVKHVDHGFWQDWAPRIRTAAAGYGKDNFFMFGEVFDGSDTKCASYTGTKAGGAYELDSVLFYPMFFTTNSVFVSGNATNNLTAQYADLPKYEAAAQSRLVTFLDNHDQPRFLSQPMANGNVSKLRPALTFQLLSVGVPCIYYGTEQNFEGNRSGSQSNDPYDREDMFDGSFEFGTSLGDNFNETHPTFLWTQRLNLLRRDYPLFRRGTQTERWATNTAGMYAFSRILDGNEAIVAVSNSSFTFNPVEVSTGLAPGTGLTDMLTNTPYGVVTGAGKVSLGLPPYGSLVLMNSSAIAPVPPSVVQVTPAHGATEIGYGEFILRFVGAMDAASVQQAFSLTPSVPVQFREIAPDTYGFLPTQALAGSTLYTLKIAPTARDRDGVSAGAPRTLPAAFESLFRTAAAQTFPAPAGWQLE